MVEPVCFGYNAQAAQTNTFQQQVYSNQQAQELAIAEFNKLRTLLQNNGVTVHTYKDTETPSTPDSIFPNNWFSTHAENAENELVLYPMAVENSRAERRPDIIKHIQEVCKANKVCDLSTWEQQQKYLEGTGSMVLDRVNKVAYCAQSIRSNHEVLQHFCQYMGYTPCLFNTKPTNGTPVYHTNVLMSIGKTLAVLCTSSIATIAEQEQVLQQFQQSGREVLQLSYEQLFHFAGNSINLCNANGESLWVMSSQAWNSLNTTQQEIYQQHGTVIHSPLETIETLGGGSARCMIAELYI